MLSLRDCVNQQLQWVRTQRFKNSYELCNEDQVFAILRYQGSFTAPILAEADDQQWIFQREGGAHSNIIIYSGSTLQGSAPSLAFMKRNLNGDGQMFFTDGRIFNWNHIGRWRPTSVWTTCEGSCILRIKRNRHLLIEPSATDLSELSLLIVFGFYLILAKKEDNASDATEAAVNAAIFTTSSGI